MTPADDPLRGPETGAGAGQGRGEEEDVYALRDEPAKPAPEAEYTPGRDFRDPRVIAERAAQVEEVEELTWQAVRHAPPRTLFFANTFNFPFHPTAQTHSLTLVGWSIAAAIPLTIVTWSARAADSGMLTGFGSVTGSVLLGAMGLALLAIWTITASVYGVHVVRETSYGCDSVEKWPHAYSLDSITESIYVFVGLAISVLPALVFAPLWDWLGWPKLLMMSVSAALLFPLLLLSMLEANSPMMPVSPPVWRSLLTAWRAWGLFYLITLPAAVLVFLLTGAALKYAWILGPLVAGVLLAAAWMIYFRLLGRLAWFCSGRATEAPE